MVNGTRVAFHDLAPGEESFRDAVLTGLARPRKAIPCKFLYDARGSALFEEICTLPEYYPTRAEFAILEENGAAITADIGEDCHLIEFGSGASRKVRMLLRALDGPAAYVPIDISREHLRRAANSIAAEFPDLPVIAVCADYTRPLALPIPPDRPGKRIGFFPGSTIGNFEPPAAVEFLRNCARILGRDGEMIIGVDLKKSTQILEAAYNDPLGVTAAFNLNLFERINRELDGNIDIARCEHFAFYNEAAGRVEIYIKSLADQVVQIGGHRLSLGRDELVHTEYSYKYAIGEFQALARRAGFAPVAAWRDRDGLFSVHHLRLG